MGVSHSFCRLLIDYFYSIKLYPSPGYDQAAGLNDYKCIYDHRLFLFAFAVILVLHVANRIDQAGLTLSQHGKVDSFSNYATTQPDHDVTH